MKNIIESILVAKNWAIEIPDKLIIGDSGYISRVAVEVMGETDWDAPDLSSVGPCLYVRWLNDANGLESESFSHFFPPDSLVSRDAFNDELLMALDGEPLDDHIKELLQI
jgi:hypothetical protein